MKHKVSTNAQQANGPGQELGHENECGAEAWSRIEVGIGPPLGAIDEIVAVKVAGDPFRLIEEGVKVKFMPDGAGPAVSVTALGVVEAGVIVTVTDCD